MQELGKEKPDRFANMLVKAGAFENLEQEGMVALAKGMSKQARDKFARLSACDKIMERKQAREAIEKHSSRKRAKRGLGKAAAPQIAKKLEEREKLRERGKDEKFKSPRQVRSGAGASITRVDCAEEACRLRRGEQRALYWINACNYAVWAQRGER